MVSENEERPTKKRTKSSISASESGVRGKKQRGRPKVVDTQDETAADRRRTQIRLAQRAYRQRKETTISSLQKQVEQLQSVIDNMNTSFLRFNDQALASDLFTLRPQLASELKSTTEQFVHLSQTARKVSEIEEEESEAAPPSAAFHPEPPELDLSSRDVYPDVLRASQNVVKAPANRDTHLGLGYFKVDESDPAAHAAAAADFYSGFELPSATMSAAMTSTGTTVTEPRQFQSTTLTTFPFPSGPQLGQVATLNPSTSAGFHQMTASHDKNIDNTNNDVAVTTPGPTKSPFLEPITLFPSVKHNTLQVPFTYSFQETTFARRLQRACLERAFHLLSTSHLRPSAFQRVFRLCRHYSTREELIAQFKILLQQSVLEPLEFVKSPFLHLGGAGTHYPSHNANGDVTPPKSDWNMRRIGPWATKVQLQNLGAGMTPDGSWTAELEQDLLHYTGEWFDSHDVQGYLEELGIHINAQASFAEATVRTFDALARQAAGSQTVNDVHPDAEMAVLEEPLDQFAPNHLTAGLTPPQQQSSPSLVRSGSRTTGERSGSLAPSTPNPNLSSLTANVDELPVIDPMVYDSWDRMYDLNLEWLGDNQPGTLVESVGDGETLVQMREDRTVTIDVQRFVNGLIKRSVCIGRGPGFRRADVNYALRAAVIEAF